QRDGATPSLALVLLGREVQLRPRVRDDEPALGIGEEHGIGDRLEDALEERSLAIEPLLGGAEDAQVAEIDQLPAEDAEDPADVRVAGDPAVERQADG